jgi:hypothetical protein
VEDGFMQYLFAQHLSCQLWKRPSAGGPPSDAMFEAELWGMLFISPDFLDHISRTLTYAVLGQ